jgi:acyl-CoA dehydrogenase
VKLGLMNEILGTSIYAPNAFGCQAPDSGNSEILALAGTTEQKERWLYPLLAGELKSAFSMTEPETPGSDPTQLRTRAVRDGDGYVLTGHKWFTSNGSIADFLIVMAVTDPDAKPHRRASMFIVPVDTPGVNLVRDVPNMEQPAQHFGMLGGHTEIVYDDVQLGPDALLGEEGDGFLIAQHRLVPGRIHHCMRWLGVARRAFDMLCERSLYRPLRGALLRDQQTFQNSIADSAAQMQAARLMTLHAAWKIDQFGSSAARMDVSLIKVFGAQVLHDVVDRALQAHGGLGYSADMPLEQLYRYARHARFVDGADEVHRESIARQILRAYDAPEDEIPTEYVPARREAARLKFAELLDAAVVR